MRKITSGVFLFLCSCHSQDARQESRTIDSANTSPAFANKRAESPAADLEWRLKQGQEGGPIQIISCTVSEKQEVELKYRNVSADQIDGARMVLFAYDNTGVRRDFAENTPYRYVTDQQLVDPGKQASMHISLQQAHLSTVTAYPVKVHYTAGGSWENH